MPPTERLRLVAALLVLIVASVADTRIVALIRHGEKPPLGNDLSDVGRARAECIKSVFGQGPLKPTHIFAQEPDLKPDGYHEIRSLQTCQPLADYLGLPPVKANTGSLSSLSKNVDISIDRDNVDKLALAVDAVNPEDATVLICWEHDTLPVVARGLGVAGLVPVWPDKDYDSIWVIDTTTKALTFQAQRCGGNSPAASSAFTLPIVTLIGIMPTIVFELV